jgi:hypothetical protein
MDAIGCQETSRVGLEGRGDDVEGLGAAADASAAAVGLGDGMPDADGEAEGRVLAHALATRARARRDAWTRRIMGGRSQAAGIIHRPD